MENGASALKVGILVLVSIVVVLAMAWAIAGGFLSPQPERIAVFPLDEGVSGLRPGSEARVGGVRVGTVRSVEAVAEDGRAHVRVSFELPERFVLREGARVMVGSGLAGDAFLDVTALGDGVTLAPDEPVPGTSRAFDDMFDLLAELQVEISQLIAQALESTLPVMEETFGTLSEAFLTIDETSATVAAVLDENRDALRTTVRSAERLAGTLETRAEPTLNRLDSALDGSQSALLSLQESLAALEPAATDAAELMRGVRNLWLGQRGRIEDVVVSLSRAGQDLELAIGDLRRSPWRLLHRPEEPLEEYQLIYDSARAFSRAAGDIRAATSSVEAAASEPAVDEERLESLLGLLLESAEELEHAQRLFLERLRDARGLGE